MTEGFLIDFFLALDSFFIDVTQVLGSLFTSAQVSPWFGSEEPHNKICMKASNTCHKRNTESLLCQATPDQFSLFDSWNAGNWPWTTRDPHLHQEWNEKKSSTNWAEKAVESKWSSYRCPILILLTKLTYPSILTILTMLIILIILILIILLVVASIKSGDCWEKPCDCWHPST